ncbi:hypothetical protein ABNQ39_06950 [Azospirillum sp. A26]|uniref:hypothetical protein n=1 Tax=Azospirillum sp. A26 TaxID=3160607 RepID=UPI003673448C
MGKKHAPVMKLLEVAVPETSVPLLHLSDAITSGACAANLLLLVYETRLAAIIGPEDDLTAQVGYLIYALREHAAKAREACDTLEGIKLEVPHA